MNYFIFLNKSPYFECFYFCDVGFKQIVFHFVDVFIFARLILSNIPYTFSFNFSFFFPMKNSFKQASILIFIHVSKFDSTCQKNWNELVKPWECKVNFRFYLLHGGTLLSRNKFITLKNRQRYFEVKCVKSK